MKALVENSYGVVKRLDVIEGWLHDIARQLGKPQLEVLDYGCGTGDHLTAPVARLGHLVLGVDVHDESIAQAKRSASLPSLSFRVASLGDLLADGLSFDVVICSEVLEHVEHPGSFLAQLRQLTRPAGALIITTPNGRGSFEVLCASARVMKRVGLHQLLRWVVLKARQASSVVRGVPAPVRPLDHVASDDDRGFLNVDSGHVQFFTVMRLEHLFASAGLSIAARRARTLLCGPYVDAMFALCPGRTSLLRWNNRAADLLPFAIAADWMFLLRRAL